MTFPADPDFAGVTYALAKGGTVPAEDHLYPFTDQPHEIGGLVMDTDYTLAIRARDLNGNVSEPYVVRFRTPADTTPPGPVTSLVATPSDYRVTASWVPPTDADLASLHASIRDLTRDREVGAVDLPKTATATAFGELAGGHDYEVRLTATDLNGLTSSVATVVTRTPEDGNGAPPAVDPATVTVAPASPSSVTLTFPRPDIADLRSVLYVVQPVGSDPDDADWSRSMAVARTIPTMKATVALPEAFTTYQVALRVYDYNGNRTGSVVPGVRGEVTANQLPKAPVQPTARSSADNTLDVSWLVAVNSTAATSWDLRATSSDGLSRDVVLPGSARAYTFRNLPGRRTWTVAISGRVDLGSGPAGTPAAVEVGDTTGAPAVAALTMTPSYDSQLVSWTTLATPDLDHVIVTRQTGIGTPVTIYEGTATSVRSSGLKAGEVYTFAVRAVDEFGQSVTPVPQVAGRQSVVSSSVRSSAKYPGTVTITGALTSNGSPLKARPLVVDYQRAGSTAWQRLTTTTTSSTGTYSVTVKPSWTAKYRVGYVGSGTRGGAWSSARTVTVTPSVSMSASRTSFAKGSSATLRTTVGPNHKGSTIRLQRWTGSAWSTVSTRTLSSTSTASATVTPSSRGTVHYRWQLPAHVDHATGTSPSVRLTVG